MAIDEFRGSKIVKGSVIKKEEYKFGKHVHTKPFVIKSVIPVSMFGYVCLIT